jgi:ABC-type antimicrobial peptide transport system permease subunit
MTGWRKESEATAVLVLPEANHPGKKFFVGEIIMVIIENLILALQSLRANPLRSILTLIGIAVGIGAVLYVVALGEITQRRINERLESMGSNVLSIRPAYSHSRGVRTSSSVINLKWEDAKEILEKSQVITAVVPSYSGSGNAEYQDKNWSTRITGTTPANETVSNDFPVDGRYFTEEELYQRAQVCLIGATVYEKLFENESPIGKSILINSKRFQVIGLLGSKGEGWRNPDDQIFVPLTTAQERLFGRD